MKDTPLDARKIFENKPRTLDNNTCAIPQSYSRSAEIAALELLNIEKVRVRVKLLGP